MCLTLNSATEWAGSTFQVVVEICGAATVVVVMVHSFLSLIAQRLFIDARSIDIDRYDGDYNDRDSDSYGSEEKGSGSDSCLAGHAQGVAVDCSLSASHNERRGFRGIRLSRPGSTLAQRIHACECHWSESRPQSRLGQRGGGSLVQERFGQPRGVQFRSAGSHGFADGRGEARISSPLSPACRSDQRCVSGRVSGGNRTARNSMEEDRQTCRK